MDFSRHSYKMIREGSNAKCVNINPGRMYRSGHEKMVKRCCDQVDLNVVEVKVNLGKLRSKPCTTVLVCISALLLSKSFFLLILHHCVLSSISSHVKISM